MSSWFNQSTNKYAHRQHLKSFKTWLEMASISVYESPTHKSLTRQCVKNTMDEKTKRNHSCTPQVCQRAHFQSLMLLGKCLVEMKQKLTCLGITISPMYYANRWQLANIKMSSNLWNMMEEHNDFGLLHCFKAYTTCHRSGKELFTPDAIKRVLQLLRIRLSQSSSVKRNKAHQKHLNSLRPKEV